MDWTVDWTGLDSRDQFEHARVRISACGKYAARVFQHVARMEERLLEVGGDLSRPIVISSESENSDEEVEPPIDSSFTFTPSKRLVSCCTLRLQSVDCCIHFVGPLTVTLKWRT